MTIEIGHNSVPGADAATVKSFADRIFALEDEKDNIVEDIRSVYLEAKGKYIDTKALRATIKRLREDAGKRAAREAAIDAIMAMLS
jgi:uncharacterized protein (UPF0335 family)